MEQESFNKGILYVGLCAFFWSLGGLLVKLIDWNPMAISSMRSFFAALTMYFAGGRPKLKFTGRQIPAALFYTGCMFLYVIANKLTTAANTILLQYTSPVYVAFLAWIILKERPHWDNIAALICVLGGMVLFFKDDLEAGSRLGNYLAMLSGVFFALFAVFMRKQKDTSTQESLILAHILTFVIGSPFIFTSGPLPSLIGWGAIVALGVVQMGMASLFFAAGIRHITAIVAVLMIVIEPLLNPVWVFLVTGEKPGKWALVGGIIIIIAVTGSSLISSRREGRIPRPLP
jgi:drug/metabolite transporter (DMT)-like permease